MEENDAIQIKLDEKKEQGWEGWKVSIELLEHCISECREQDRDYIVFALESEQSGTKKLPGSKLFILGHAVPSSMPMFFLAAPTPGLGNPGQIDDFPPWPPD